MMAELLDAVVSWPSLLLLVVVFGFAPGFCLRLIVLAYPRSDPRRAELIAELYTVPRVQRPLWVAEQLEVALFEGLAHRVSAFLRRPTQHAGLPNPRWQPTALTLPPLHTLETWENERFGVNLGVNHPRIKALHEAWDAVVADICKATAAAGQAQGRSWRRCLRRLQRVTGDPRWTQIAQDVRKLHKFNRKFGPWMVSGSQCGGASGVRVPTVSTLDSFLVACAATRDNIHRMSCG